MTDDVIYVLCRSCRGEETARARASLEILGDPDASDDERAVAAEELGAAVRWLSLPAGAAS